MATSSSAPGNLYNANLALCLRVNELMQVNGQQWVDSGRRLFNGAVSDSAADYARLVEHKAGTPATASASEVFWGEAKRWSVRVQAEHSLAFEQRRSLTSSLREAVTTWGSTVNGSLARTDGVTPLADAWVAELTKWTQAWPVVGKAK